MKASRLEPGLLTIFRLFLLVQFSFMLVNLHVHSGRGYLADNPWFGFTFIVGGMLLLLVYLSWTQLERQIAHVYLPLAVVYSTVYSLLAHYLFLTAHSAAGGSEERAWQLFLFLCVPLVLVSWQYEFKWVLAYCLFATFLDLILVRWTITDFALFEETYHRLSLIRFLTFLIVGHLISRIMQQLRKERRALKAANRKLEDHLLTLEQLTVSRERNRMARELHDTLAHTLSSLAVQLEAVDSLWTADREQAHTLLRHSLRATRDGLTETRKAIQSLRATPLEDLGFVRALQDYAETTAGRTGFRLEFDLPKKLEGLSPEVEQCFYRIGQEAIENVARHAQATCVQVKLTGNASALCLQILDDGVGFDMYAAASERHFGLQGMHERAELIHADLEVVSQPGAGTRLQLSWNAAGWKNGGNR